MIPRRKKLIKRLLIALNGLAPLSTNKGPIVHTTRYISKKDKRHSGWVTPRLSHPEMKYSTIIEEGLEPQKMRDEWSDWRDGGRNYFKDASHFKKRLSKRKFENPYIKEWAKPGRINKKLMKKLQIRRAVKLKKKIIENTNIENTTE